MKPPEPGELRRAVGCFSIAMACLTACSAGMTADSDFGGQNAAMIGALIFVPWGVSALASLLFLLNLVIVAAAAYANRCRRGLSGWLLALRYLLAEWPLRAITGRWHPDQERIRTLEYECEITPRPKPALLADPALASCAAGVSMAEVGERLLTFMTPPLGG